MPESKQTIVHGAWADASRGSVVSVPLHAQGYTVRAAVEAIS